MTTEEYLAFEAWLLVACEKVIDDKNSQVSANPNRVKAYIEETQRQRKEAKELQDELDDKITDMGYEMLNIMEMSGN